MFRAKDPLLQGAVRAVPRAPYFLAAAAALLLLAGTPVSAAGIPLATYRAVHDLILDPDGDAPGLSTMNGRVVTEFNGSECAGYTSTTRFVTESVDADDKRDLLDSRSITIEKADGSSLDFDNQTVDNGIPVDMSKGVALRGADGTHVKLTTPSRKTVEFEPDVIFPTEQTTRTIAAALAGERFLSFITYDGLDNGETTAPATVIIGEGSTDPSDVGDEAPIADAGFATMRHWPVRISYFDATGGEDHAPDYAMSAILYENGIMRRLKLDYGRFTLVGKLVRLDILPAPACP